jgi:molybdopterin converting factor small subunit
MPALSVKENIEIVLLFFGATADISGVRRVRRSMASETKVSKMLEQLIEEYPKLSTLKLLVSINREYSTGSEIIRDGDELAIFTSVSGG